MPWISRERYEHLLAQLARCQWLQIELDTARAQIDAERQRTDRAVDELLEHVAGARPISPPLPQKPELGMFEEDADEVTKIQQAMQTAPMETLLDEGSGDGRAGA